MAKVIVGMSGGVDSAVAAYLLKEAGYEVTGVTLRTWASDGEENRCCEIDDARRIADRIGIEYRTLNCEQAFRESVVAPFVEEYVSGRTPNPCVICNRRVKWEWMLYLANVLQAEFIATGHYASVVKLENGRYSVRRASSKKDQAYMLYRLTQEQLSRTILPLSGLTKEEVRAIAGRAGLPVAQKKDSQEICFIPDNDHAGFIERFRAQGPGDGPALTAAEQAEREGSFVDQDGNIRGTHKGIIHYTIGQRKRLNLSLGHPVFVKEIRPETNEVVIALDEAEIMNSEIEVRDLHFQSIPDIADGEEIRANVKVRYHHEGENAVIRRAGEDRVRVVFDRPVRAAAPGQSAVFYDESGCVIGGGIIAVSQKGTAAWKN